MKECRYFQKFGKTYLKCRYCKHCDAEYERCRLFDVWIKPDMDGCTEDYIKACEQIEQNRKNGLNY